LVIPQALQLSDAVEPLAASTFAWDHAQPLEEDRLSAAFSLDAKRRLGVCGDFFGANEASGVEAAALSGLALSIALVPHLQLLSETDGEI
jgi:predicted NAD/FAD-dependent oxidoreductase